MFLHFLGAFIVRSFFDFKDGEELLSETKAVSKLSPKL